jgi:formiminotetrahydrofolate cyclodeaminase
MADQVHVHNPPEGGGGGAGWFVAIFAVVLLAIIVWFALGRGGGNTVPEQIDVDINVPTQTPPDGGS